MSHARVVYMYVYKNNDNLCRLPDGEAQRERLPRVFKIGSYILCIEYSLYTRIRVVSWHWIHDCIFLCYRLGFSWRIKFSTTLYK